MLVAAGMGSNGDQPSLPFGYDLDNMHGIGLPNFLSPGPPPGQPLLNEHDNQTLNSFFSGFEAGSDGYKQGQTLQGGNDHGRGQNWIMPPTFVGSETSFRGRAEADWQSSPHGDFAFGPDMNTAHISQGTGFDNTQVNNYSQHSQFDLLRQIHSIAHGDMVDPYFNQGQYPQSYHDQATAHIPTKPPMRFGSDQHFQPGGYAAPEGQFEPAPPSLDWLEPHSSANNTQPNTRPNTQPSSPVWTKKRKLDDFSTPALPQMGQNLNMGAHVSPPAMKHKASKKRDQAPFTPASGRSFDVKQEEDSPDVQYEKDDNQHPTSPDSSAANHSRPTGGKGSPNKNVMSRRKQTAATAQIMSKSKVSRPGTAAVASTSRVPLTADQKKANHTNSEQRRRDATAKAYAELYDLIPELNDLGKQSTMKKLEIVVAKVAQVKERVAYLRSVLGVDGEIGVPRVTSVIYPNHTSTGTTNIFESGGSWQRQS